MRPATSDDGVVLVNVLIVLALASTVLFEMVSLAEISVRRSQQFSASGQALSLIRAGEATAIAALRRDMIDAPDIDNLTEEWAAVAQDVIDIEGGQFALSIEDAQSLFNLNSLDAGGLAAQAVFGNILAALDLPEEIGIRIGARIAAAGPLLRLQDVVYEAGVSAEDLDKLSPFVTVLARRTDINLNTAPEALVAILAQNAVQARFLVRTRDRSGLLTSDDVAAARVAMPGGVGYRTDFFRVTVSVTIDDAQQSTVSLLQRRRGPGGAAEVVVVARESARAAVLPPPPLLDVEP